MELLKDRLNLILEGLKKNNKFLQQEEVFDLLKNAVSRKEFKHLKPIWFRDGILRVNVDSSAWLYQFSLKKDQILKSINDKSAIVKDINFRIGDIK